MNDNVRKVFDLLGVEPNERFKVSGIEKHTYRINEQLYIEEDNGILRSQKILFNLLNGSYKIIKLPKKKKLRDLTKEEYIKWGIEKCKGNCEFCPFHFVKCDSLLDTCWINYKELYSDEFLDQEIEVE